MMCSLVNYEDAPAHDRLICVATNDDVSNENRKIRYTKKSKSGQEMTELFADIPQALATDVENCPIRWSPSVLTGSPSCLIFQFQKCLIHDGQPKAPYFTREPNVFTRQYPRN